MNTEITEIQIDSNGEREDSYRTYANPKSVLILNELMVAFPNALGETKSKPELISIHEGDGINYFDRTISIIYKGSPSKREQESYGCDIKKFCDYYGYKHLLNENIVVMKAYDAELWQHRLPALVRGTQLDESSGIGIHFGDPRADHLKDVYFYHDDVNEVMAFYDKTLDNSIATSTRGLFSLVFDANTLDVYKLKRYIFPNDLSMERPERI